MAGLNDADAIYKIAELTGKDPRTLAEDYGVIAANQGDFSRGISSSVDSTQAGLYGLTAWAGEGLGLDSVRDWGYEGYKRNMGEVQLRSKATDNIENAETFGDYVDATQYWAGYAIPQIAEAIIGSKGAGFLTRKTLERGVEKQIAKRYGKDLNPGTRAAIMNSKRVQAQLDKIPAAVRKGEYAGIYGQAVGTELGHTYGGAVDEAIEHGKTIEDVDYGRATKYGLAAGAAEGLTQTLTLGLARLGPAGSKMQNLLGKDGALTSKSRTLNATSRGLVGGTAEGTTEILQTGLEEMGAGKTFEEADFRDPTSFFAGFVGGGMMGGAGGATVKKRTPQDILDEAAEATARQEEAETAEAEEAAAQQAEAEQVAAEEEEADRVEELRDVHSQTFPSLTAWSAEQKLEKDIAQKAQLQNPNSELSIEFKAWRKANQIFLSNDDAENKKIVDKFLKWYDKETSGTQSAQDIRDAHIAALDDHAALQEEKGNRDEATQGKIDASIAVWLERRRKALIENNAQELLAIEEEVVELDGEIPLVLAEWQENKRMIDDEESFDEALGEQAAGTTEETTTEAATVEDDIAEDTTTEEVVEEETPFELTPPEVPTQKEFDAAKKAEAEEEEAGQETPVEPNENQGELFSVNPFRKTRKIKGKDTVTKSWQRFENAAEEFGQDFETQYEALRTAIFKGASDNAYKNKLAEARQLQEDRETVGGIFGKEMRVMGQVGLEGDWQSKTIELLLDAANRGSLEEYLYYEGGKWKFAMQDIAKAITGKKKDFSENDRKAVEKALNAYRRKQTKFGEMSETRETVGEFLDRTLRKMRKAIMQTPQEESIDATQQALEELKQDPATSGINIIDRASDTKVSNKAAFTPPSDAEIRAGKKEPIIGPQKQINNQVKSLKVRVPILKRKATLAEKKNPRSDDAKRKREAANKAEEQLQGLIRYQNRKKFEKQREDLVKKQNKARNLLKTAKANLSKARQGKVGKSKIKKLEDAVDNRQKALDIAIKNKDELKTPEAKEQLKLQRKKNLADKKEGLLPEGQPTPESEKRREEKYQRQVGAAQKVLTNAKVKADIAQAWNTRKSKGTPSFEKLVAEDKHSWTVALLDVLESNDMANLDRIQKETERSINEKIKSRAEAKAKKVAEGSSTTSTKQTETGTTTDVSGAETTESIEKITKKSIEGYASKVLGRSWRKNHSILVTHLKNGDKAKAMRFIEKQAAKVVDEADKSSGPIVTNPSNEKMINNMFRNLLGERTFNRLKHRIHFLTPEEATKLWGGNYKKTAAMIMKRWDSGGQLDPTSPDGLSGFRERGKDNKADQMVFFPSQIEAGHELSTFFHEIGSHIGLDNILSPSEQAALVAKIKGWAKAYDNHISNSNPLRIDIAQAETMALEQGVLTSDEVAAGRTMETIEALRAGGDLNTPYPVNLDSQIVTRESNKETKETIAYFITEAIQIYADTGGEFGTSPTVVPSRKGNQASVVGKILNKFRQAFRELIGYQKGESDNLTGQHIIDMAMGAARIELDYGGYSPVRSSRYTIWGQYRSTVAFMDQIRDTVTAQDVTSFRLANNNFGVKRLRDSMREQSGSGETEEVASSFADESVTPYWQKKIDGYVAKKLPKNDKRKYIVPNGEFLEVKQWSEFQREQGRREKAMRAGLKSIVEQRQREAQKQADIMNDSDSMVTDSDMAVNKPSLNTAEKKESKNEVEGIRKWVAKTFNPTVVQIFDNLAHLVSLGSGSTKFVHQIINDVGKSMPAAKAWYDAVLLSEKTRQKIKMAVEDIVIAARELPKAQLEKVNQFIAKSTIEEKWAYNPYKASDPRHAKVTVDAAMKKDFNNLSKEQQKVIKGVFNHGILMLERKKAIAKVLGVDTTFFNAKGITGPYAPLRRFGNYVVEFKSQALLDAEAAFEAVDSPRNLKKVNDLKSREINYSISFHGTMGEAKRIKDEKSHKYAYSRAAAKSKNIVETRSPEYKVLQKVLVNLGATDIAKGSAEYKAIEDMVTEMYFDSLDESNARHSQKKRAGYAGYEQDMLLSFKSNATSEANLIANMEHGKSIYQALANAKTEAKKNDKLERVYNLMVSHHTESLVNKPTPIQDRMAAVNTVYMLTSSIGYHVTNATQVMMVTIPKLVGDFGVGNYAKSIGLYIKGLKIASDVVSFNVKKLKFQTHVDISKAPKKYQALLEELQLRQLLDVGMDQDLAEFNRSESGFKVVDKGTEAMSTFSHRLYQVARMVEAYNRVSTATAAFELAEANKNKVKRMGVGSSMQYAITMVEDTQGNFSSIDAPLILKKAPKVMGQYRKYQIMMAWVYSNAAKKSFKGASAEEKAMGRRTLGMLLGHAGLFSGAVGIPFSHMIAPLFMGMGEGEEPEDLERWIQEHVQDETLAKMLSRGLPSVFGVDMSTKLSQQKIFSLAPYTDFSMSEDALKKTFAELLLGPTSATLSNFARSYSYAKEGNAWRAIEYGLPKGIRTAMESYRLSSEGYSLRNGDIVASPEDFSGWQLIVNSLGIPATDINQVKWKRGEQYELNKWFSEQQSMIRKRYVEAKNNRDSAAAREAMEDWKALQKSKDRVRPFFNDARSALRKTPISSLLKAPNRQQEREAAYREQLRY